MSKPKRKELEAENARLRRRIADMESDLRRAKADVRQARSEAAARTTKPSLHEQARQWVRERADHLIDLAGFGPIGGR